MIGRPAAAASRRSRSVRAMHQLQARSRERKHPATSLPPRAFDMWQLYLGATEDSGVSGEQQL